MTLLFKLVLCKRILEKVSQLTKTKELTQLNTQHQRDTSIRSLRCLMGVYNLFNLQMSLLEHSNILFAILFAQGVFTCHYRSFLHDFNHVTAYSFFVFSLLCLQGAHVKKLFPPGDKLSILILILILKTSGCNSKDSTSCFALVDSLTRTHLRLMKKKTEGKIELGFRFIIKFVK